MIWINVKISPEKCRAFFRLYIPKWWTWWWWCSMLWLLLPILITVRSPDSGSNRLWMGADRGLSMGGNFRLRRRSTGPMGPPLVLLVLLAGAGAAADAVEEVGKASARSGSLARMMSTSGPQVLNRPLASSMVRPRSDLPFTLIISSPRRNLPSLEIVLGVHFLEYGSINQRRKKERVCCIITSHFSPFVIKSCSAHLWTNSGRMAMTSITLRKI